MRKAWGVVAQRDVALPVAVHVALTALTVWIASAQRRIEALASSWDGEHFLRLAGGYEETSDFAFAPLWPMLIDALGGSWQAALAAAWLLSTVAVGIVGHTFSWRGGLLLACFPTWVAFSSMAYSEALFVATAAAAFWALRREAYWGAGVFAALAVATRYVGAVGFAALAAALWYRHRRVAPALAFAIPVGIAGVAILAWHTVVGAGPLTYFEAQQAWDARLRGPRAQLDWLLHGWFTNQSVVLDDTRPLAWVLRNLAYIVPFAAGVWVLVRALLRARGPDEPDPTQPRSLPRWASTWRVDPLLVLAFSLPLLAVTVSTEGMPALSVPRLLLAAFPTLAVLGQRMPDAASIWLGILGGIVGLTVTVEHLYGFYA